MKTSWCCDRLKLAFEERLSRGIFIYAEPPKPKYDIGVTYWIGMRSIDYHEKDRFLEYSKNQDPPLGFPLPQALLTWKRVDFCPWCGKKLEKYYKNSYQILVDKNLSDEHQFGA